ncbi:hypothetical protein [Actinomycetospora chiangmaiensis]|uniref:hypothetical protein n=1 Tax=Actinomycetospora chiangmaiensis TaxID=402650 RepID=UPI0003674274|nr:hypothetical protein [Actinomycetospora chiangmaiensis]
MPGSERTRRPDDGTSSFIVLVLDPVTGELDSYGPYDYPGALVEACRRREEFDRGDLVDVLVAVVPLHPAPPADGA